LLEARQVTTYLLHNGLTSYFKKQAKFYKFYAKKKYF